MANILIVEDDPLIRDCLVDLLETEDFQVTVASDGYLAQKIVTQQNFDLILCDLLLPQVNGYEFLSYLRNNQKTADIPFIVLTGKNQAKDIILGKEMGVDDYLIKPFVNQDLIKSIKNQLEKKQFLEKCYQAKIQNCDTELTEIVSPSNLTFQDNLTSNQDCKNDLENQSHLIDSFNKKISKYINKRVELSDENSSNTSSIAVCCLLFNDLEQITTNSQIQSAEIMKLVTQRLISIIGHQANITSSRDGKITIILPYIKTLHQAEKIIRAGQDSLSQPLTINSQVINLKFHVGISFRPNSGYQNIRLLLDRAPQIAEEAKKNRDDFYEVYAPNSLSVLKCRSLVLLQELKHTLSKNQLMTNYQPQVDLLTGKVKGYEASLSWNHPRRGVIPVETLMNLAKDADLIESITTKFMFDECVRLKKWHQKGFDQLKLAINISSTQFNRNCLVIIVKKILTEVQLEPQFLAIEVTESTLLKNKKKSLTCLSELKSLGVEVTLSNFTNSYSFWSYLKQFPFTVLKVDLSYLSNLWNRSDSLKALKYITMLARRFDLELIIKGVETKQQLIFLRQHHLAIAQGDYFSPSLDIDKFEYWLSENFK